VVSASCFAVDTKPITTIEDVRVGLVKHRAFTSQASCSFTLVAISSSLAFEGARPSFARVITLVDSIVRASFVKASRGTAAEACRTVRCIELKFGTVTTASA
jgi:hypothetical protein